MRKNHPVTSREHDYNSAATLMSTTDVKGRITYANAAFVAVSGFTRDELIGQPHNLIRHPDMPPEAFADLWQTLRNGESWTALVKNRRKNGDHYWVLANVTPIRRNNQLLGYMSVRTKPLRAEIDAAEALYRRFREGKASGLAFHKGLVVRVGWRRPLSAFRVLPARWRVRLGLVATASAASMATLSVPSIGTPAALGLAGAAAALGCWWLERQVTRPLSTVLHHALRVASGASDQPAQLGRVDEVGMLLRATHQAGLNLRSLMDDVSEQIEGLQTASSEIAAGNGDLSARTEQTASSLEQTAAAMDQIHGTVRNSAASAQLASQRASAASAAATRGGEVVSKFVATMDDISASSRRIADIIAVIDSIAFQTNILSLNAAVEAARAGEEGRGFAVVASEVRSLARKTAEAAREIKQLITASVETIEQGSTLVTDASLSMETIVTHVSEVDKLLVEISRATQEQSSGVGQINAAIAHLDQTTQQNAALVEQSAAAAESLMHQAFALSQAINVFRSETIH